MTGQLRTTLDREAEGLQAWAVDLDAIVARGERHVRRRRATIAGSLAALLVVGGGIFAFAGLSHRASPAPADQDAKPLAYAVGQVIHDGTTQIDTGVRVESMVRVVGGFVFSGPDRTLYLERGGTTSRLGHLADRSSRLYASDDGLVAAWWDGRFIQTWPGYRSEGGREVVVVHRTNLFGAARSWPSGDPPRVEGLSAGHLWWWTGQRHMIGEVRPTPTTAGWTDTNPPGSGTVVDAAGDHVLVRLDRGMAVTKANLLPWPIGAQQGWQPGGDLAGLVPQVRNVSSGDLAPDGQHWFTQGGDQLTVFDSGTGRRQDISHPGFAGAVPYQWLSNDTIAAVAQPPADARGVTLLTCRVSTNTCAVAVWIDTTTDVVLSDGRPSGG